MFGYNIIIQFLEHEMTIAGYALIRKIYHRCFSSVSVVVLGKVPALVKYALPESSALDVIRAVLDLVAEVEHHRNFCRSEFLVRIAPDFRSKSRLNSYDCRYILRICLPAYTASL